MYEARVENIDLIATAIDTYGFKEGIFPISNGKKVSSFVDLYPLTCSREWLTKICSLLGDKIFTLGWKSDYIAGKELHGSLIASNLVRSEKSLESDLIIIRKDTEPFIRSPYDRKSRGRVILIDDVISAGINMLDSLKLLEEAGYIVSGILCVVYRGGGAEKLAEDLNIPFKYLLRIEEEVI